MRKELCAIQQSERRYSTRWWRQACRADVVSRARTLRAHVRFGSKADIGAPPINVRFTPESRHMQCTSACPRRGKSGHRAYSFASAERDEAHAVMSDLTIVR